MEVDDETVCAYRAALDEWQANQSKQKETKYGVLPVPVLSEKSYAIAKARAEARG